MTDNKSGITPSHAQSLEHSLKDYDPIEEKIAPLRKEIELLKKEVVSLKNKNEN